MTAAKPTTIEEYAEWARQVLGDADLLTDRGRRIYDTNVAMALSNIQASDFVRDIHVYLEDCDSEYRSRTGTPLRMETKPIELSTKSYKSVVDKMFRRNVLWNSRFPKEPVGGWAKSSNVYTSLDDLVRSTIVSKFLDGPEYLAQKILSYGLRHGLKTEARSLERDDGYYAFHVNITFQVDATDETWSATTHALRLELQITTQLQEVLRELTHRQYERVRLEPSPDKKTWKWKSRDARFRAGFLSHSLHLLEGLILELRDDAGALDAGSSIDDK